MDTGVSINIHMYIHADIYSSLYVSLHHKLLCLTVEAVGSWAARQHHS